MSANNAYHFDLRVNEVQFRHLGSFDSRQQAYNGSKCVLPSAIRLSGRTDATSLHDSYRLSDNAGEVDDRYPCHEAGT